MHRIAFLCLLSMLVRQPASGGVAAADAPAQPALESADDEAPHIHLQRVPLLGPVTAGNDVAALPPPSDSEIIQALVQQLPAGRMDPALAKHRKLRVVKKLESETTDPERFIPLIGQCKLHHACYRCTVYSLPENTPSVFTNSEPQVPVTPSKISGCLVRRLYIDHNHFHMIDKANNPAADQ